ncbi:hypothetical protein CNMCM8980_000504 [Aspergillus fumigatiaffinis]|nr:hypothetical protein CNMCM8980_000504 [Aspergillus fumigatiaffinis]
MQFSTILSLLAVAGMAVAAPSVARRQSNGNGLAGVNLEDTKIPVNVDVPIKGNSVANDVLEDGVNVEHVAHDINAPVGAGVLGNVNQVAPKGGLPPF